MPNLPEVMHCNSLCSAEIADLKVKRIDEYTPQKGKRKKFSQKHLFQRTRYELKILMFWFFSVSSEVKEEQRLILRKIGKF